MQKPSIGRVVHYVSFGTPGGEYASECRAAVITEIGPGSDPNGVGADDDVSLAVLNPTGMFFNRGLSHDEETKAGGTWHWPERVPDRGE